MMQGRLLDNSIVIPVGAPFREVCRRLLGLLQDLEPADWGKPTVHPERNVKDLAAHLLHGSLRRVTGLRDGYRTPTPPISSTEDLIAYIQQDNREFMTGMHRVSPGIIVEMMEKYDPVVVELFSQMDLHEERGGSLGQDTMCLPPGSTSHGSTPRNGTINNRYGMRQASHRFTTLSCLIQSWRRLPADRHLPSEVFSHLQVLAS